MAGRVYAVVKQKAISVKMKIKKFLGDEFQKTSPGHLEPPPTTGG